MIEGKLIAELRISAFEVTDELGGYYTEVSGPDGYRKRVFSQDETGAITSGLHMYLNDKYWESKKEAKVG